MILVHATRDNRVGPGRLPFSRRHRRRPGRHAQVDAPCPDQLLAVPGGVDAIFCVNDDLALGALRRLHERGYRVPEDVAVIGVDGTRVGGGVSPTLSTICPDTAAIAASAVRMLRERIAGAVEDRPRRVKADFTLLARETTMGAKPFRRRART